MDTSFDDLRPYLPHEIPPAMQRIAASDYFPDMARFIFPEREIEDVRRMVSNLRTTHEFQMQVMCDFVRSVLNRSVRRLTFGGLHHLHPDRQYLFIANHRDIVLDSSLMLYVFHCNSLPITEISFGSNLMVSQLIIDIGKSNKMYTVRRSGNLRELYEHSLRLSRYLRHAIIVRGESIWIAQRNGRTKDGNDLTDQGIIKMFCMSRIADPVHALMELNVIPVAISYQIEPCDILKTRELYASRDGKKYIKQPGEDLHSVLTGILQPKGDIHLQICPPLSGEELLAIAGDSPNEFYRKTAALIDTRIWEACKLHDNNYIAHDLRSGADTYATRYTPEALAEFETRYRQMLHEITGDESVLRKIFLGIYANPVDNKLNILKQGISHGHC
ncbi:MAG: acyltransferase [Tannerella sp.]|jgi:hypothetical protein|nr:acyltransferase [Tannerella sp.]